MGTTDGTSASTHNSACKKPSLHPPTPCLHPFTSSLPSWWSHNNSWRTTPSTTSTKQSRIDYWMLCKATVQVNTEQGCGALTNLSVMKTCRGRCSRMCVYVCTAPPEKQHNNSRTPRCKCTVHVYRTRISHNGIFIYLYRNIKKCSAKKQCLKHVIYVHSTCAMDSTCIVRDKKTSTESIQNVDTAP